MPKLVKIIKSSIAYLLDDLNELMKFIPFENFLLID